MKRFMLTILGVAMLGVAPALAADLPARTYTKAPPPVAPLPNWAGFYIGVNGGGAWSRNCWDFVVPGVASVAEGCHNATGGTAGGQIGYRWQAINWVFGLEAQGNWADLKGSNASLLFAPLAPLARLDNQTRIDAIGLFTGQVGYAWDNVLLYVKGGAAVTHDKYDGILTVTGLGSVNFDSARETRWGGVIGTGVEFGFAPNWSVALEYDHLFMGSRDRNFTFAPLGAPGTISRTDTIRQDVDMGTVRVNYRFGGPVVARY